MSKSPIPFSLGGKVFELQRYEPPVSHHRGIPITECCFNVARTYWYINGVDYLLYRLAGDDKWLIGVFYDEKAHTDFGPFETIEAALVAATLLSGS